MSTPAQRKALERYAGRLQHTLGLDHWSLSVGESYSGGDEEAGMFITNNADAATLHVPELFWTRSPESQRATVLHELLHLHFDRALLDFYAAVRKVLPEWITDGLESTPTRIQERSIERFALAIAPNLPLPKVPGGVPSAAMGTEATSETHAAGGKSVRAMLDGLHLKVVFRASGHKSSEGDGRTAADIERELAAKAAKES